VEAVVITRMRSQGLDYRKVTWARMEEVRNLLDNGGVDCR